MNFSWWTFALQAANFLILVWLLQRFLFKPIQGIVSRRKEEISRALNEASVEKQAVGHLKQEIEAQKSQIEAERQRLVKEQSAQLSTQRQALLEQARADAEKLRAQALAQLQQERAAATAELFEQSVEFAVGLAKRLLEELALPSLDGPFLARAVNYLDRLSAAERTTLQSQLGANEPVVTTAHMMTVDEQAELRDRLEKRLGANNIRFEQDPALIAGAKIEFAHSILSFNWRDSLDAVKKEVREPHESAG